MSSSNLHLTDTDDNKILVLIERDWHMTTREMSEILGINLSIVVRQLHQMECYEGWCIDTLWTNGTFLFDWISVCYSLLKNHEIDPVLKQMVTSEDKLLRGQIDCIKGIVFYQHNTILHVSLTTWYKLVQLSSSVLVYSPYSLDLVPSDYIFFRLLQKQLRR